MQIPIIGNFTKNTIKGEKAIPGHFSYGKYIHQMHLLPLGLTALPKP